MTDIQSMHDDLKHCYECREVQSCVGCPYNGCKVEIMQYLLDLRGDFTEREQKIINDGIDALKRSVGEAFTSIRHDGVKTALNSYYKELIDLQRKINSNT